MGSDKTLTTSNIVAHTNENLLISSNLEVGTSNLFVNTANGNVGIGTNDPKGTLHSQGTLNILGSNAGGSGLVINDVPNARWKISTGGYALRFFKHNTATDEYDTWSEKVRIDQNGNVGIGKTNPSYKLDVSGDVQLQGAVGHALYDSFTAPNSVENMPHYGIKWASTGGSGPTGHMSGYGGLRFFTVGSARMSIAQGGNVGIGTTNPGQKLEVGYYGGALSSDFGAIRITNHATNLHETSIARFDISLGDIDAGTGSGRRKLIFNSKTNTLASGTDILCLDGEYNNVGIGIASPNHKLDVNGVIKSQNTRFSAYSSQANTVYPILTPFILEHTNENTGSAYNTSNGIFTVPVTGVYCFQATVYLLGTASQIVFLYRSSSSAGWQDLQPGGNDFILTCGAHSANSFSMTYKFNANNQIAIGIRSNVNANIWIYRSHTYFSGFLISPS
jgi:hypothetical protein